MSTALTTLLLLLLLLSRFSHVRLFVTPWSATCQASLSITSSQSLLKLMCSKSVMPSNHLILCPSPSPPAFNLSQHQGLSNVSVLCIRWPKDWSFSFSISPSNQSGLISFRIDWFDLLAVQVTLNSLLQYHSSKTSNALSCFNTPRPSKSFFWKR